ncbi:polysaccharide deacetylase family protein [Nonlabens arenilitoris]|uniref:Polysaccharide deacetylase family protein n=1 Tax=Nonlabens arenilitoris TaxID=1217969 RepID=A0A2S7U8I3_9FLAO|nr:polysaccharide deacetylase family protein [Nonlabens arenilitoris]PQJ31219.1 polysaccharide deacetylase family protein [Nonlabens arenilitoris]
MHWYPDRISDWFSGLFSGYLWHGSRNHKVVYITFDDGPHPIVTPFVLKELDQYNFKATFFCIGDCVKRHNDIFDLLSLKGHSVGNHTFHHLNSWKHPTNSYLDDIDLASSLIDSRLFRPPYGRITSTVSKNLRKKGYKIVLWDVLSGDFDSRRTAVSCLNNLKRNTRNGSIIVFHDSEKAFEKLKIILPAYFEFLHTQGYKTSVITHTASI